jgi:hypothetical protein
MLFGQNSLTEKKKNQEEVILALLHTHTLRQSQIKSYFFFKKKAL